MKTRALLLILDSEKVEHGEMARRGVRLLVCIADSDTASHFPNPVLALHWNIDIAVNKLTVWFLFLLCSLMDLS